MLGHFWGSGGWRLGLGSEGKDCGPGNRPGTLRQAVAWLTREGDKGQTICRRLSGDPQSLHILESPFLYFPMSSFPLLLPVQTPELNAISPPYLLIPCSLFLISFETCSLFLSFPSLSCFCSILLISGACLFPTFWFSLSFVTKCSFCCCCCCYFWCILSLSVPPPLPPSPLLCFSFMRVRRWNR